MFNISNKISQIGTKNYYSFYAALFRLFICFHLLKDLVSTWKHFNLLYKGNSFLPQSPTDLLEYFAIAPSLIRNYYEFFLMAYVLFICLFFFGIGKYFTALVLFILYELQQRLGYIILNGGDNLLKFILLYMVFIDSYKYFSISPLKIKNAGVKYVLTFLSNTAAFSICLHLCLAYFLSAWHKIHADVWFNGVATYYTLSLERFRGTSWNLLLVKNGIFVTISTYFTMLVEIYYPVLIWFKKTKKVISICAIFLHIGIYIFMMIYDFQIIFIMVQGFFFTNHQWISLINKYRNYWGKIYFKFKKTILNAHRKNKTQYM